MSNVTHEQLRQGQAEAARVTRTAYAHRELRFPGLAEPVLVMPSGDAYIRTYATRHGVRYAAGTVLIGRVIQVGKELQLLPARKIKGKAAQRQQKHARRRARLAGAEAAASVSHGLSHGRSQADVCAAPRPPLQEQL